MKDTTNTLTAIRCNIPDCGHYNDKWCADGAEARRKSTTRRRDDAIEYAIDNKLFRSAQADYQIITLDEL